MGNKSPIQIGFFKNSTGDILPTSRFLGGLYYFCNFVNYIFFNVRLNKVVTYFTDSEMIKYYQKSGTEIEVYETKNVINYARYTMHYENIKIKL